MRSGLWLALAVMAGVAAAEGWYGLGAPAATAAKPACQSIAGNWSIQVDVTGGPQAGWSGSGSMDLSGTSSVGGPVSISFSNGVGASGQASGTYKCANGELDLTLPLTVDEPEGYSFAQTYYVKASVTFQGATAIAAGSTWTEGTGKNADSGSFSGQD